MENCVIEMVNDLPEDIENKMQDDLVAYEASHEIDINYKRFSLILKNDSHKVIGVLNAYTAFSEIYIDDIEWVIAECLNKKMISWRV